jgi:tRNA(Ile)-lysidine synthase
MRTAEQYGAGVIALAHHADDQAETVLMRIIHGAGPAGLAGMPVRREAGRLKLIRPLLRIYKSDIIAYCNEHHIRFCTDSSNQQRKYERNRIRLDAIPFLERYNPKLSSSLNRLADVIRGEDDYMSLETERLFRSSVRPAESGYQFVREPFLNVHVALQRRLIKLILSYLISEPETVDFAKVEMIRKAILNGHPTTLRYDLDEGVRFVREYESIRLIRCEDGGSSGYEYRIDRDTRTIRIGETGATLHLQVIPPDSVHRWSEDPYEAYFDLDVLRFPLRLRTRRPGDRIEPIGMNGTKKVKDLLIDRKIPPSERDRLALVVDADNSVLWIPGIRRSSRALVRNGTANVLHMKLKPQRAARLNHE